MPHRGWSPSRGDDVPGWPPGPGGWVADPIPAAVRPRGPHRRRLLVGGAALAVAGTAAGVVTWQDLASEPHSPEEAAEAFMAAGLRYDWRAAWELLCRGEQLERGPFEEYAQLKEAGAVLIGRPSDDDVTVTADEVRPHEESGLDGSVVGVELARGDDRWDTELVVVREDDGFRTCGTL